MYKIEFYAENTQEIVPFEICAETLTEIREIAIYLIQFRVKCQSYGYGKIKFSSREPKLVILDSKGKVVEKFEQGFEKPVASEKLTDSAELFIEVGYEVVNRIVDRTISFKLSASTVQGARKLPTVIGEYEKYLSENKKQIDRAVQVFNDSMPSCHGIAGWR